MLAAVLCLLNLLLLHPMRQCVVPPDRLHDEFWQG